MKATIRRDIRVTFEVDIPIQENELKTKAHIACAIEHVTFQATEALEKNLQTIESEYQARLIGTGCVPDSVKVELKHFE